MFSIFSRATGFTRAEARKIIEAVRARFESDVPEDFEYTPPEHYTTYTTKIMGITINYAKVGQGPSIVLLHGLTNNWYGWGLLMEALERDFTLYVLDLPGYGDSGDLFFKQYSLTQQAEYVSAFIEKIVPDKPIVVGLSMGSLVTAEVGRLMGEDLRAIVLNGPVFNKGKTSVLTSLLRIEMQIVGLSDKAQSIVKRVVASRWFGYASNKYMHMFEFRRYLSDIYGLLGRQKMRKKAFVDMSISVAKYELQPVLESIAIPTLLIFGKYDKVSQPDQLIDMPLNKKDNVTVEVIDEAGHVVPVEKPEEVANAIRQFVSR